MPVATVTGEHSEYAVEFRELPIVWEVALILERLPGVAGDYNEDGILLAFSLCTWVRFAFLRTKFSFTVFSFSISN